MMLFCFSILFAFWCKREVSAFVLRVNQQSYRDANFLFPLEINEEQFIQKSQLQPKETRWSNSFFIVFPLCYLFFKESHPLISLLLMLIFFLSVLDILYYLTDPRYVVIVFIISLGYSYIEHSAILSEHIETLLVVILFFTVFQQLVYLIFRREGFGMGDVILLVALAPLFELVDFFEFLLVSAFLGICFYFSYRYLTGKTLTKLPFIPFIGLSFVIFVPFG